MKSWDNILQPIQSTDYYKNLMQKVDEEYEKYTCYPPKNKIFRALELTSYDETKVVIIGQDPYHNELQANGLSFSASNLVKTPSSLVNIFKELKNDLGINRQKNELDDWAKQGVLLLNSSLSVRSNEPNSHHKLGWECFTNHIISELSKQKKYLIFLLWGNFAQKKKEFIHERHGLIQSAHPSPLSAYRGFFGSMPFSKINQLLIENQLEPIEW